MPAGKGRYRTKMIKLRDTLLLASVIFCSGAIARAGQIEVDFTGGEIPIGPGSTVTTPATLPALLGGNADSGISNFDGDLLFLKFKIPDISQVLSINSFTVSVTVYDDEVDAGESAEIDFAQPGTNIVLASPAFTSLNGTTAGSSSILTYSLSASEISQVFPTITDGNFRVRIMRETGDFEVAGGSASIDAVLSPEPDSVWLAAAGICGLALTCSARRLFSRDNGCGSGRMPWS